jgi:hypothetical protein
MRRIAGGRKGRVYDAMMDNVKPFGCDQGTIVTTSTPEGF